MRRQHRTTQPWNVGAHPQPLPDQVCLRAHNVRWLAPAGNTAGPTLSADFEAGSFTALVAAGDEHTSQLLLALAGIAPIGEGTLTSSGVVASVLPDPVLFDNLTIQQNLDFPGILAGRVLGSGPASVPDQFMELVGPLPPLTTLVSDVDHETYVRVALLRALATQPRVLLVDHPLPKLASVLRIIADQNLCTVIVSTDSAEVASWADRVISLKDGHVASESRVKPRSAWRKLFHRDARPKPAVPEGLLASQPTLPQRVHHVLGGQDPQPDRGAQPPQSTQPTQHSTNTSRPATPPVLLETPAASASDRVSDPDLPAQPRWLPVPEHKAASSPTDALPAPAGLAPSAQPGQASPIPALPQLLTAVEPDPVTQEIATLAAAQVHAIEEASRKRAATPDPLRDELGLAAPTPATGLPLDSAQVAREAQEILQALPGSVMPES